MRRTYTAVISTLAAAGVASATAGCQIIIGVDDTTEVRPDAPMTGPDAPGAPDAMPPDAGPLVVARVRAEGLLGPVMVRLQAGAVDETITVDADGTAAFPTVIDNGGAYAVTLVGGPACALGPSATGTAAGDVTVDLACQGATRLTALTLDTLTGTQPTLVDGTFTYTMAVSELQQLTRVTASPRSPAATMTVQGVATAAGVASGPVGLTALTSNVTIVVDHPLSAALRSTYTVNVSRSLSVAHVDRYKQFPQDTDFLGWAIGTDGSRTIVGACREGSANDPGGAANPHPAAGTAYVYRNVGDTVVYEDFLKAPNAQGTGPGFPDGDLFGWAVAIDGDVAVASAIFEDSSTVNDPSDNGATDSGAAYVFRRVGTEWLFEQYLKSPYPTVSGFFGWSVAVSGDTIAVGAYSEHTHDAGGAVTAFVSGQVHVFRRVGNTWILEDSLEAPTNPVSDRVGASVALRGDTLVSGALGAASGAGGVLTFTRSGTTWTYEGMVTAPGADNYGGNFFGASIAFDGATMVAGMQEPGGGGMPSSANGAAFVFPRLGGGWGTAQKLTASNGDPDDQFSRSVALAGDLVAVFALNEDGVGVGVTTPDTTNPAGNTQTGAVYLYRRNGASWSQVRYIKPQPAAPSSGFGIGLAIHPSGLLLIGASGEDTVANNSGAFYVLR